MRPDLYERLPATLKALVDEIEECIPFQIEVLTKAQRPNRDVAEAREDVIGAIIGYDTAIIETPANIEDISEVEFAHELLHLRRVFVERVPHVYARKIADHEAAANIDNWLEHVVIYERQLALYPSHRDQMNRELVDFWNRCPWEIGGVALRFNLLTRLMITRLYGSDEARQASVAAMARLPPQFGASRAARETLALRSDKRAFVRHFLAFCGISPEGFWLRRCEPEAGRNTWEDL